MGMNEKVIKGLECCTFILGKRKCEECPYKAENGCYQLQEDFHAMTLVVRCRNCYYRLCDPEDEQVQCVDGEWHDQDWFCAAGRHGEKQSFPLSVQG